MKQPIKEMRLNGDVYILCSAIREYLIHSPEETLIRAQKGMIAPGSWMLFDGECFGKLREYRQGAHVPWISDDVGLSHEKAELLTHAGALILLGEQQEKMVFDKERGDSHE
jgi:hypothetical protein